MTKIHACNCKHAFQDEKYGKGKRVFNRGGTESNRKWTCTVCGTVAASETSKGKK